MLPATPTTAFRYFDILLLLIIIIINTLIWRFRIIRVFNWKVVLIAIALVFFLFPYVSAKFEAANVFRKYDLVDDFNLLYIWLTWPIWWIIGIIELFVLKRLIRVKEK
jgi:hypothetical protein